MTWNERLRTFALRGYGSVAELGRALKIPQQNIQKYVQSSRVPGLEALQDIFHAGCSIDWLFENLPDDKMYSPTYAGMVIRCSEEARQATEKILGEGRKSRGYDTEDMRRYASDSSATTLLHDWKNVSLKLLDRFIQQREKVVLEQKKQAALKSTSFNYVPMNITYLDDRKAPEMPEEKKVTVPELIENYQLLTQAIQEFIQVFEKRVLENAALNFPYKDAENALSLAEIHTGIIPNFSGIAYLLRCTRTVQSITTLSKQLIEDAHFVKKIALNTIECLQQPTLNDFALEQVKGNFVDNWVRVALLSIHGQYLSDFLGKWISYVPALKVSQEMMYLMKNYGNVWSKNAGGQESLPANPQDIITGEELALLKKLLAKAETSMNEIS
ncbi:MAG: XRE family transcriptional regulator [Candidatus Kapaibacterium sp.]|nr:MAG: XRE family transcriptional regulator [Candidatus Kapabacteria bacterium]